ncbi:hypothetical protein LTR23_006484 [Exophiala sp. CCFEE 6169]|nr:hypothetical protein LTR23_006484 [Chaetothyriales sp. CCFEE 6169]
MLDNLALPFLLAASSCTRSNIRKTLVKEAKFLEIHIAPPLGVLRFDLDFRNGVLRRIIDRHSSHNSARGVLTNTSTDRRAALQQMEEEMRFIGDTKTNMQAQASKGQIEVKKGARSAENHRGFGEAIQIGRHHFEAAIGQRPQYPKLIDQLSARHSLHLGHFWRLAMVWIFGSKPTPTVITTVPITCSPSFRLCSSTTKTMNSSRRRSEPIPGYSSATLQHAMTRTSYLKTMQSHGGRILSSLCGILCPFERQMRPNRLFQVSTRASDEDQSVLTCSNQLVN